MQAFCDDADFESIAPFRYYAYISNGGKVYAARKVRTGRKHGRVTYTVRYLHHDIAGFVDGFVVDHEDGDSLNNRRANLRVCTQSVNIRNSPNGRKPGVFKCASTGRFAARASVDGRRYFLGRFDTFEEAAEAVSKFRVAHLPAHKPTDKTKKTSKNNSKSV
jgi:hypothetical protein